MSEGGSPRKVTASVTGCSLQAANRWRRTRRSGRHAAVVLGACAILFPAGVGTTEALGFPLEGAPTPSQPSSVPAGSEATPPSQPSSTPAGSEATTAVGSAPAANAQPVGPSATEPTAATGGHADYGAPGQSPEAGSATPGISISIGPIGIGIGEGEVRVSAGGGTTGAGAGTTGTTGSDEGAGTAGTATPSITTSGGGGSTPATSTAATTPTAQTTPSEAGTTQTQAPEQSATAPTSASTATPTAAAASTATSSAPTPGTGTATTNPTSSAARTKFAVASSQAASANALRATRRAARGRRAHRATGGHADAGTGARAAGGLAPADLSTDTPLNGRVAAATRRGSHRRTAPKATEERLPPIVTTITKIVGIVPLSMRVLIGVLIALALAFAARSRFVARRARRLTRQRGELLEDVGLLQAALLPVTPSRLGAVSTTAAYRPADGPGAGGDFYDIFALEDGRLAVVVGDVSGHGRTALPRTALVRFTLRAYLEAGLTPRQAVQTAGAVLERQLGDSFATAAVLTYQPADRTLTYSSAGHPPPIVLGEESVHPITACSAPPIGAGLRTGTRETVMTLPGNARVCVHTDGITEARVGADLFGTERLRQTIAGLASDATATELLDRVAAQTDLRPDDMAACLLMVDGGAGGAPATVLEELELDGEQVDSERTEQFLLACGVPVGEIQEILRWARADARRTGSVTLKVRRGGSGSPEVTLAPNNVTSLQAASLKAQAAGAAL